MGKLYTKVPINGLKHSTPTSTWFPRRQVKSLSFVLILGTLIFLLVRGQQKIQGFLCHGYLQSWNFSRCGGQTEPEFSFTELEGLLQNEPSAETIAEWSRYYSSTPHFAGQGKEQGEWTRDKWAEFGIPETWITEHDTTICDPLHQRLALMEIPSNATNETKLLYEATLTEDVPKDDPSTVRTPAYLYSSASGNVTAQFVYANYGYSEDYDDLEKANVNFKGKIAVVKYGAGYRGEKIDTAAKRGLIGVILYTDPQQDGNITESRGYKPYPDGPARPGSYIARGAINRHNLDLRGPNYAVNGSTIPSIPASFEDITPILRALNGHGPKADSINKRWRGGDLGFYGVGYHTGPSPPNVVLNLNNQVNYFGAKAYNVLGMIKGTLDDQVIVLGNHRDAWTQGTTDGNSGSAALMEVARSFGLALRNGWKPQRSIVFGSWDAHEVGLVGSRGWIAQNLPWLSDTAVAYLNVVVAAAGTNFRAKGTPLLYQTLRRAASLVKSPENKYEGQTVMDAWGGEITGAGGGDSIAFLQTACISTLDMGFIPRSNDPPFPYHSNFDTQSWMTTLGDPGWEYHLSTTKIWSLMAAQLSESPVLKISSLDYANKLNECVQIVKKKVPKNADFDFTPLEEAATEFHTAAYRFDNYASTLDFMSSRQSIDREIREVNTKYKSIERQFCYRGTSENPIESEHVIFGASAWFQTEQVLPRLLSSFKSGNMSDAAKWRSIIQSTIENATAVLQL